MNLIHRAFLGLALSLGLYSGAGSPEVKTLVICGGGTDCPAVLAQMKAADDIFREQAGIGITVEDTAFVPVYDCPVWIGLRMELWKELKRKATLKDYDMVVVAVGYENACDVDIDAVFGILGMTEDLGVVWVKPNAQLYYRANSPFGPQFDLGVLVHEIGHLLGAEHIKDGIMHPVMPPECPLIKFSKESLVQILWHRIMSLEGLI